MSKLTKFDKGIIESQLIRHRSTVRILDAALARYLLAVYA